MALLSRKITVIISGVLFLGLTLVLLFIDFKIRSHGGPGIFEHQFSFTKVNALHILSLWGDGGQSLFLSTMWLDYIYPVVYAFFLSSLMAYHSKPYIGYIKGQIIALALIAPFVAAFFDFVENAYQIVQVTSLSDLPEWMFFMTSLSAVFKWFFILSSVILIIYFKYAGKRTIIEHI